MAKRKEIPTRILAVDPGTYSCGWALFEHGKLVESGHVESKKKHLNERLHELYDGLCRRIVPFEHLVMEDVPYCKQRKAYYSLGCSAGVVLLFAHDVSCETLGVPTWKKIFVGNGNASKDEVMAVARLIKPGLESQDEADAIGIGTAWHGVVR